MFTQLSRWSPVIDPRNGEDGPPTNQVAHHTPFIPFYPMISHIGPRRVHVTHSNETPQSLPLISLTSPEPTRH